MLEVIEKSLIRIYILPISSQNLLDLVQKLFIQWQIYIGLLEYFSSLD